MLKTSSFKLSYVGYCEGPGMPERLKAINKRMIFFAHLKRITNYQLEFQSPRATEA